ncbi:Type II secretion system protein D precursor [Pseudoalteromonas sp. THAF3]|uniref:secretin N-terminal domain-containing protein n=1 Tax=Pseudoalteromonas sp. THAF3 TaxID=2587843 RepID=UPI0012AA3E89|nr:secretin N-terminal domain-containing protein [Pseudoalteromonas sp. THAF3]QFU03806.1 Type II secretion system protein D precursor [Pseudoalteromonas sp. THAF3]
MVRVRSLALSVMTLAMLSACAMTEQQHEPVKITKSALAKQQQQRQEQTVKYQDSDRQRQVKSLQPVPYDAKEFNNDTSVFVPPIEDKDTVVNVSANQLALPDFLHLVMGENLGLNYVIDDQLQKSRDTITLNLPQGVSKEKLYEITVNLLLDKDMIIEPRNEVLFVMPRPRDAQSRLALGAGRQLSDIPKTDGQILQFVPLEYVDYGSLTRIIKTLTNADFRYNNTQNALSITGTYKEVEQVIKIVNAFDKPSSRGKYIRLIELVYTKPEDFKEQLATVMDAEGLATSGSIVVTPMPRMRSILVHTSSQKLLERIEFWAEQLDVPTSSDGRRYFTYFPKNIRAEDLGESLKQLFGLEESAEPEQTQNRNRGRGGQEGYVSDDISMAVDKNQNVLMFYTTPSKYHDVVELIEQIDILPGQVLIEAAITEVTLEGNFSYGVDWSLADGALVNEDSPGKGSLLNFSGGGLSYTLSGVDYSATLNFLQGQSRVNILSKPRILVKDGSSANLNVGTEIPLLTQTSSDLDSSQDRVVQNVQYRNTGVTLSVTPTINAQGVISVKVNQSVSEAGENKLSGVDSPIILNRSFSTELLARDGQTIVLGGLISENNSDSSTQVPLLGDLPLLGNLFKSQGDSSNRVELIVMLTPRIIRSDDHINELLDVMTQEFKSLVVE